jgi:hypothetical protein
MLLCWLVNTIVSDVSEDVFASIFGVVQEERVSCMKEEVSYVGKVQIKQFE